MNKFYLEVGCGRKPHPGFKTIDIEAYAKPDYLGDFRTMNFSDVDGLRAHHILEHFSRDEAINVLKLWHSWLKPEGTLIVETPDFDGMRKIDLYDAAVHTFGSQEAEWAFHRDGWWEQKFRDIFPQIGFEISEFRHSMSVSHRKNKSRVLYPNVTVIAKKI